MYTAAEIIESIAFMAGMTILAAVICWICIRKDVREDEDRRTERQDRNGD